MASALVALPESILIASEHGLQLQGKKKKKKSSGEPGYRMGVCILFHGLALSQSFTATLHNYKRFLVGAQTRKLIDMSILEA